MLCFIFVGATMLPMVNATVDYAETFDGSVGNEEWFATDWFQLYEGQEVEVISTPDGPCDLDMYVDSESEWSVAIAETPSGAETVYFIVPYDAHYRVAVWGWWVPEETVDFTIDVTAGTDIFPEFPAIRVTPTDNNYGDLKGWTKAHANGINHASFPTAVSTWPTLWENNIMHMMLPPPAQRPHRQFCAEDNLLVGAFAYAWYWDPGYTPTLQERKEAIDWLKSLLVEHFIDNIPLASLTKIQSGPVRPEYRQGVLWRYYWRTDCGAFKSGELAEAIGLGLHIITTITTFPDGSQNIWFRYFELVSVP